MSKNKGLDFNNMGAWSKKAKMGFCVVISLFILVMAYLLHIRSQREELVSLEAKEVNLRMEFEKKQVEVANLEPLRAQLERMEQALHQMLRQLPSKTEMPDLIVDISQTALASGLSNELFKPGPEEAKEFYAEKPIELRMVGSYHQFGAFVSGVASLPRVVILTMHDISLKPRSGKPGSIGQGALELSGTVRTYRYLDDSETVMETPDPARGGR
ncbi:MAG: type 4a pilus biogenesis protein PilO [Xanthomonadaceae bacterium]|jgi:type IV pilus assembly protein PilO|nr:type 4a pilus biogenesis protein PilO [Xanthomonadaceae bacterium]